MRRIADGLLETAAITILSLAMSGGLRRGGLVDPADCFTWIAGLALAAVPVALVAGRPRPAPGPVSPTRA
jgi:hypothetical protein